MKEQLDIIKKYLPFGYSKILANEVGCSRETVKNIMNDRTASKRSAFRRDVITAAINLAKQSSDISKEVDEVATNLREYGTNS